MTVEQSHFEQFTPTQRFFPNRYLTVDRKNCPSSTTFFQEFESQISMGKLGNKMFSSENESNVKEKSSPGIQELNHFF